jgi:hypothetical protein
MTNRRSQRAVERVRRIMLAAARFTLFGNDLVGVRIDDQHTAVADVRGDKLAVVEQMGIVWICRLGDRSPA